MATMVRRPFANRQLDQVPRTDKLLSPFRGIVRPGAIAKRPHSPEGEDNTHAKKSKSQSQTSTLINTASTKVSTASTTQERKDKGKDKDPTDRERVKKQARQQAREEFVYKYTKAFPSFVFFFDQRDGSWPQAEARVTTLGARIEQFFSASVTHVITNQRQPPKNEQYDPSNKENISLRPQKSRSPPIQLKSRFDHEGYDKLVRDAVQLNKKIWDFTKLESILERLLPQNAAGVKGKGEDCSPALDQLLENERIHGTLERDPREKRHDYTYFAKGSYFLLIEDIRNELAPIGIMEYSGPLRTGGADKPPAYPVLYMDPRARSPYTKYDEKEARRLEKGELNDRIRELEKETHRAKVKTLLKEQHLLSEKKRKQTLRRRASMGNLEDPSGCTHVTFNEDVSGSCIVSKSLAAGGNNDQAASGYGPSTTGIQPNAYLAASGNSVTITSTTTTSFARNLTMGATRLPAHLQDKLHRQVFMRKRTDRKEQMNPFEQRLRKAKSTTTIRLPLREENKKPGYCEACRVKFEDFKDHVKGTRHRKFAQNDANYVDLDILLRRLKRKTEHEIFFSQPDEDELGSDHEGPFIPPNDRRAQDTNLSLSDDYLIPGDYFYAGSDEKDECMPDCEILDDDNAEIARNEEEIL